MKIVHEQVDYELVSKTINKDPLHVVVHWHNNTEIIQLFDSTEKFIIDGKIVEAEPGDIVFIKEHVIHNYLIKRLTFMRIVHIHPSLLLNTQKNGKRIKTLIKAAEIDAVPGLRSKLDILFMLMDRESSAASASNNPYFKHISIAVYSLLAQHFSEDETHRSKKRDREDFYKITEYVNNNFRENINTTNIGQNLFISRNHITRLFIKFAGMTLTDYIRILRINHATQLMNEGLSITEAALESGFQCVRTFNSAFKKEYGITPVEFKKSSLNNSSN